MNQYSELLLYLKQLGEADPFINTITKGSQIDLNKANVFPMLNININSGSFTNAASIVFNVELTAVDIRDINKEQINDKFWENDNEVDNLNETLAVLNRIWTTLKRRFDDNDYSTPDNPGLEAIIFNDKNILDGWTLTFSVELPNDVLNLCQTF